MNTSLFQLTPCVHVSHSSYSNEDKFKNGLFIPNPVHAADISSVSTQSLNCPFFQHVKLCWRIVTVA